MADDPELTSAEVEAFADLLKDEPRLVTVENRFGRWRCCCRGVDFWGSGDSPHAARTDMIRILQEKRAQSSRHGIVWHKYAEYIKAIHEDALSTQNWREQVGYQPTVVYVNQGDDDLEFFAHIAGFHGRGKGYPWEDAVKDLREQIAECIGEIPDTTLNRAERRRLQYLLDETYMRVSVKGQMQPPTVGYVPSYSHELPPEITSASTEPKSARARRSIAI